MAAKQLLKCGSFQLNLGADAAEWQSNTGSDDEAYFDCVERNSSAGSAFGSTYNTPRQWSASAGPSSAAGPGGIADVAVMEDADLALEALAELRGPRPEVPASELPAVKRARVPQINLPPALPRPAAKPVAKPSRKAAAVRSGNRTQPHVVAAGNAQQEQQSTALAAVPGSLRVQLMPQPDGTVKLSVQPAVYCFGGMAFPTSITAGADAPATVDTEAGFQQEQRDDPTTGKDQTKDLRRTPDKGSMTRKSVNNGFPGSFIIKRLWSSIARGSSGGGAPTDSQPNTARQLGLQLLAGADPVADAAAHSAVVVAGFVQAAPGVEAPAVQAPAAEAGNVGAASPGAAHRVSAEVYRNVLQAAASPKPSPRDTAFVVASPRGTPQKAGKVQERDQQPVKQSDTAAQQQDAVAQQRTATPARGVSAGGCSDGGSPGEKDTAGLAALALLTGLGQSAAGGANGGSAQGSMPGSRPRTDGGNAGAGPAAPWPLLPNASGEVSDGGGIAVPLLEKCDSPMVTPRTGAAAQAAVGAAEPAQQEGVVAEDSGEQAAAAQPAAASAPGSPSAGGASAAGSPAASPGTVSRRAYGTMVHIVKKMVPSFRDSSTAMSLGGSAPAAVPGTQPAGQAPAAELAGPAAVAVPAAPVDVVEPAAPLAELPAPWEDLPSVRAPADVEPPAPWEDVPSPLAGGVEVVAEEVTPEQVQLVAAQLDAGDKDNKAEAPVSGGAAVAGSKSPAIFIFGQEQPPKAGTPKVVIKQRSTSKPSTPTLAPAPAADGEDDASLSTRKRKADKEVQNASSRPCTQRLAEEAAAAAAAAEQAAATPAAAAAAPEAAASAPAAEVKAGVAPEITPASPAPPARAEAAAAVEERAVQPAAPPVQRPLPAAVELVQPQAQPVKQAAPKKKGMGCFACFGM